MKPLSTRAANNIEMGHFLTLMTAILSIVKGNAAQAFDALERNPAARVYILAGRYHMDNDFAEFGVYDKVWHMCRVIDARIACEEFLSSTA